MRFETLAVHAGGAPDPATGAVAPPIHLSTTFVHGPESEPLHGRLYIREGNPTEERLESALAALEGGARALAFASGMAAATRARSTRCRPAPASSSTATLPRRARSSATSTWRAGGRARGSPTCADLDAARAALAPARDTRGALGRDADQPAARDPRPRGARRAGARGGRAAGRRRHLRDSGAAASARRSAPTSCCIRRPSTWAGTATCRAARSSSRPESALLAERCRSCGTISAPSPRRSTPGSILRGLRSLACRMERHSANALAVARASPATRSSARCSTRGSRRTRATRSRGARCGASAASSRCACAAVALRRWRSPRASASSPTPPAWAASRAWSSTAPRARGSGLDDARRPAPTVGRPRAPRRPDRRSPPGARRVSAPRGNR